MDIIDKANRGRDALRQMENNYVYDNRAYRELLQLERIEGLAVAFDAGFYAGLSAAINRGYSKTNDPRKSESGLPPPVQEMSVAF